MLRTFLLLLAVGSWALGCGDDSGSSANNSGSGGSSGGGTGGTQGSANHAGTGGSGAQSSAGSGSTVVDVPKTKKLSDVSSTDLMALCRSHMDQFNQLVDPCTGAGFDASSKSACEAAAAACKADAGTQSTTIDCNGADASGLGACNVTVGEFETCLGEIATYIKSLTCANFQNPPSQPACFVTIQTNCQALFGP